MNKVEEVALAIEAAEVCYEMKLIRLVDGESTYRLSYDGDPTVLEFSSTAECHDDIAKRKHNAQARAAIEAMRVPSPEMLTAIVNSPGYEGDESHARQDWQAAIDAALTDGGE